jgi:putative ABC transport system permease protein
LPKDAPNHFALNILPDDRQPFAERLAQINALSAAVPGDARPPDQHQRAAGAAVVSKDSTGERAIQRDLSLTWAADLPQGNALTAGNWWQGAADAPYPACRWRRSWPKASTCNWATC